MIFHQLHDPATFTYTYLLGDRGSRQAILIDPVREQLERDLAVLSEQGLALRYILETHVHADHVTAASTLRARTGAQAAVSRRGAGCADRKLAEGDSVRVGGLELRVLETPGHTDDSLSFALADRVFTGDALLIRGTGRTDFQNGDAGILFDSITHKLFALPDATLVFPGHDYRGQKVTTIGAEKRENPRLAGRSREEFVALMARLDLPRPARIDEAVPANRACGEPRRPASSVKWRGASRP